MNDLKLQQELNEIKRLLKQNFINGKDILTSKEVISYLNISYSMLTKLTSNSMIPYYKPTNGVLFFLKSEIYDWVKGHKIYTENDIESLIQENKKKCKNYRK